MLGDLGLEVEPRLHHYERQENWKQKEEHKGTEPWLSLAGPAIECHQRVPKAIGSHENVLSGRVTSFDLLLRIIAVVTGLGRSIHLQQ